MQEKKLAIMQPYFFPYIGYFQLISAADTIILYDNVDYIKRGWINRNRLLEIHRGPVYFGFEVEHVHPGTLIRNVHVRFGVKEREKLLKNIYHNYHRSAFFDETYPVIEDALSEFADTIMEINGHSISVLAKHLDIHTKIRIEFPESESIEVELSTSFDKTPSVPVIPDKKTQRILNICRLISCENYINPIGGQQIYSPEVFRQQGVNLRFIQTLPYSYNQTAKQFYKDLSIIDVLMNCGKKQTKVLLNQYSLL
jgi:hypothetical protein